MATTNTCMGVYQFDDEGKRIFSTIIKPLIETHTGLTYVDGLSNYDSSNIKMDLISNQLYKQKKSLFLFTPLQSPLR